MVNRKTIIFCILISTLFITGLSKKADFKTAEKFAPENLRKMVGSRSVQPHWIKNSEKFWYKYKTSNNTFYYIVDTKKVVKSPLFDREKMISSLSSFADKKLNNKIAKIKKIEFKDESHFTFEFNKKKFLWNISKSKIKFITDIEKKSDKKPPYKISPDKKWIIYSKDHNLFLNKKDDSFDKETQLTFDGEKWFSYAKEDGKDQSGKRVKTAAKWFNDSKKIYIKRVDKRKVEDLFLVHSLSRPRPTLELYKYAMAGDKNIPRYEISVIDIKSLKQVKLDIKKWKDQRIGSEGDDRIYITDKSKYLFFIRSTRDYKKVEVCRADTDTGKTVALIHETSEPYWNSYFQQFYPVKKTGELIWQSERDGREHFYLYNKKGKLINRITKGNYTTGRIVKVDEEKRILYFEAYGKEKNTDPYYKFYYRVNFNGTGFKLLTPENATHSFSMNESMNCFIDTFSTVKKVPVSVLRDSEGKLLTTLEKMDVSKLISSGWKPAETFKVKAADGVTDLYGVMWKPFNFDPEKKYPLISYVYPGPQGEPVPKTFFLVRNERVSNIPLAQLGFIVISVGQRGGSPLRSKKYHNFGYDNARDYPLADNKFAIEQLGRKYSFIDMEKIGIYGRSGGGFMSTAAMLVYPDFYKVAVSSCGNHNNNIYDYEWGELHYKNSFEKKIRTNQEIAKNLKGYLLLIHGEVDNNVHPANTIRMVDELIKAGKRFDLMIFPGKKHTYGEYTRYLERMMWYYFSEHLLGDYRTNVNIYKKY